MSYRKSSSIPDPGVWSHVTVYIGQDLTPFHKSTRDECLHVCDYATVHLGKVFSSKKNKFGCWLRNALWKQLQPPLNNIKEINLYSLCWQQSGVGQIISFTWTKPALWQLCQILSKLDWPRINIYIEHIVIIISTLSQRAPEHKCTDLLETHCDFVV